MNQADLYRELIAAARRNPPSERVPHSFEKRILARIRACPGLDHWALWSRALWRAVAPCTAIMLVLGAWLWFASAGPPASSDLSQQFENTVLAAANPDQSLDLSR
jgi:hypothetical protein